MRVVSYFIFAMVLVMSITAINCSSAYAKTIEAGESNSNWQGTGEIQNFGDGEQAISGIVKGVVIVRHKGEGKTVVHSAKLVCPARVTLNRKEDYGAMRGLCTIVAHEGKDIAYAEWRCTGTMKECEGDFTFTGGAGGFKGISGTTPFQTSILFELQEGNRAQAVGYAVWPNLTFTLP